MRALSFAALIVGVVLIPTALGLAKLEHDRVVSQLERTLVAETDEHGGALEQSKPPRHSTTAKGCSMLFSISAALCWTWAVPRTR